MVARRRLTITPVSATVRGPPSIVGGNTAVVDVTGPHNQYDTITIVPAGAPEGTIEAGHNDCGAV